VRALVVAVGALAAVAVLAKAAVVGFGLPDWVFSGGLTLAVVGLGVALFTAYAHRTSHAVSAHMTWRRAFRGGGIAVGAFAVAVAAIMIMRVFGVGPAASLLAAGTLHGRERLLVIDFNAGKDSSLSHVVTEAVRTNLGQSQVVSIMPPTAIAAALTRAQKPASTPLDLPLARDIAQREGVKAIVAGDVTQLGAGYVVAIRLVSADSGSELAAYRKTVNGTSELLEAIDDLTRKLRGRIGESLKSVRDAPALDQVTTSSLEALQKYAEASRAFDLSGDYVKAAQLLREAVAKDTTFAMAYRKLGVALSNAGMPRPQIDSALTRAYQFRDRLPDKERYLTIATYYSTGPGLNRQKAAEAFQQALNVDTSDMTAAVNLANQLRSRRQFARAESLYAAINRSPRASQISMGNHAGTLVADGKAAEAESLYREMAKRFPAARAAQVYPAIFLYKRGQYDSAEAFWKKERDNPNPIFKLGAVGSLAQYAQLRGRLKESRVLSREVTALNAARGVPANPLGDSLGSAAVAIWYFDEKERGAHALDAALAQVPLRTLPVEQRPYFQFAAYYALAGKTDKARALIAQFDADVKDAALRLNTQPARHSVLAEIAMAEKRPLDAVREIWASDSLPDGPVGDCARCGDRDLGRAYDLASMPDSAIFYWERYLNEATARGPGVDGGYLAGIYKRLGELHEAKGETKKAATYYVSFLDLWKNADPELQPKVQDVKRRLAAIQASEKR
jgi:Flp pilus assembly protein TadD